MNSAAKTVNHITEIVDRPIRQQNPNNATVDRMATKRALFLNAAPIRLLVSVSSQARWCSD